MNTLSESRLYPSTLVRRASIRLIPGAVVGILVLNACTSVTTPDDVPQDADGDGWTSDRDCDDQDSSVYPGADDVCDGLDNNCDGLIDHPPAGEGSQWYPDRDGDGFGETIDPVLSCTVPDSSYVAVSGDCDDHSASVYPGASELCDALDNDCDGRTDEDYPTDQTWYPDQDQDGFGAEAYVQVSQCRPYDGFITVGGDCDDSDAQIHPEATEVCEDPDDDPVDNNCDGAFDEPDARVFWYPDEDQDGFGETQAGIESSCQPSSIHVTLSGDCDDTDPQAYPNAIEVCDGDLEDCSGTTDHVDADGDGYSACDDDCDDTDSQVHPDATEVCGNGVDEDCSSSAEACPSTLYGIRWSSSTQEIYRVDSYTGALETEALVSMPGHIAALSLILDAAGTDSSAMVYIAPGMEDTSPQTTDSGRYLVHGEFLDSDRSWLGPLETVLDRLWSDEGRLVGLEANGSTMRLTIVDQTTGTLTYGTPIDIGTSRIVPGAAVLLPENRTLFQIAQEVDRSQATLYQIDPDAGTVLATSSLEAGFVHLCAGPDDQMTGLAESNGGFSLYRLNPGDGSSERVANLEGILSLNADTVACDSKEGVLYVAGFEPDKGSSALWTVRMTTGVILRRVDLDIQMHRLLIGSCTLQGCTESTNRASSQHAGVQKIRGPDLMHD